MMEGSVLDYAIWKKPPIDIPKNLGVKLFFEESAITTMNSALQYFDKDSQKMNDSLGKLWKIIKLRWKSKNLLPGHLLQKISIMAGFKLLFCLLTALKT